VPLSVKLIGHLLEYLPDGGADFDGRAYPASDDMTVTSLAAKVGLPEDAEFFVMVNGDHVVEDDWKTRCLNPDDEVVFCPPLKGG